MREKCGLKGVEVLVFDGLPHGVEVVGEELGHAHLVLGPDEGAQLHQLGRLAQLPPGQAPVPGLGRVPGLPRAGADLGHEPAHPRLAPAQLVEGELAGAVVDEDLVGVSGPAISRPRPRPAAVRGSCPCLDQVGHTVLHAEADRGLEPAPPGDGLAQLERLDHLRPPAAGANTVAPQGLRVLGLGHEGELLGPHAGGDLARPRPPAPAPRVVTLEAGPHLGAGGAVEPHAGIGFRAPLAHAGDVGHQAPHLPGRGRDAGPGFSCRSHPWTLAPPPPCAIPE